MVQFLPGERHQYVVVNGHVSDSLPITSSVPRGSVLGPLLFLIYMNDLPLYFPKYFGFIYLLMIQVFTMMQMILSLYEKS